jgi:hypothetical protein
MVAGFPSVGPAPLSRMCLDLEASTHPCDPVQSLGLKEPSLQAKRFPDAMRELISSVGILR